ncbi:hypothetical protein AgCh_019215 [Apium graveolens]
MSEPSLERRKQVNLKEKKSKKIKLKEEEENEEVEENLNAVSNFRISELLRNKWKSKGIEAGAPYQSQHMQLKRGVDIVVGTLGCIKDHIERGNLDFSSLKFCVFDKADEMLKMCFVDDVELFLGKVEDASLVQTLLFSATLPIWMKHIVSRFLKPNKKIADLVGNEKMKASINQWGRSIIFTETKDSASQLTGIFPRAGALHGGIQQTTGEVTLVGFRSGKFMTLVATNVTAWGLDINDVQLIIQCEPPRDIEAYIHRSGRMGREEKMGVVVTVFKSDAKELIITSRLTLVESPHYLLRLEDPFTRHLLLLVQSEEVSIAMMIMNQNKLT